MKRIVPVSLAALMVLSIVGSAWAESGARIMRGGYYISARSGGSALSDILFTSALDPDISDVNVSLEDAKERAVAFGFALKDGKVGLEYSVFSVGDGAGAEFDVSTMMVDGSYEQSFLGPLHYYMGAGIGSIALALHFLGEKDEIQRLAYKFRGGLLLDLGKAFSADIGYSYLWSGNFNLGTSLGEFSGNFINRGITAGLSFYF
ncbi:MAG: hypothetical protein P1S46_02845 [bacterium]|nr:hypothetical protein [bacterium]